MKVRAVASFVMVLGLASAGAASASSIGVFFAPDGSDCDATIPANTPVTWYILAVLGGDAAAGGITGAEFRQDGTPAGWSMTATPNPASTLSIGNPIGTNCGGANIAWVTCQQGSGGVVLLYTVSGLSTSVVGETRLQIKRLACPSELNFPCPLLVICDAPVFTKYCVPGGEAIVNGGACTVGVEDTSWSTVKSLFN